MKNEITLQLRAFPVTIKDTRSGEVREDMIVLDKEQLRAAQSVGMRCDELIYRIYNYRGYWVQAVGHPMKREVKVDLGALFSGH